MSDLRSNPLLLEAMRQAEQKRAADLALLPGRPRRAPAPEVRQRERPAEAVDPTFRVGRPFTTTSLQPGEVKVWPLLGLASSRQARQRQAGAWRLWTVARSLDLAGSGVVTREALRARLRRLEVPDHATRRWLRDALQLGALRLKFEHGAKVYRIASLERFALAVGISNMGSPAAMPLELLFTQGWQANVWGAFLASLHDRPMSRERMRELTGVPPRTQARFERQMGISSHGNYAISELPADAVEGLREVQGRPAFAVHTEEGERAAWWLPRVRQAPAFARRLPRGRARKANDAIKAGLSLLGQAGSLVVRLFHPTSEQATRMLRRHQNVREAYRLVRTNALNTAWAPVAR